MLDPDGGTPTPGPSPLGAGVSQIRPNPEEALAPGKYADMYFEPRVTFEIFDDTWFAMQRERGFFDIQQGIEDQATVIAIQFASPTGVYGQVGTVNPDDAAHAVEILSGNSALDVIETDRSQIGGIEGSQITFENNGSEVANFMDLPPGTIGINPGRRIWVAFFDTPDGMLAVMVGGAIEGWDAALAAAEPILESIQIGTN